MQMDITFFLLSDLLNIFLKYFENFRAVKLSCPSCVYLLACTMEGRDIARLHSFPASDFCIGLPPRIE